MMDMGPSRPTLYEITLPRVGGNVNQYLKFYCKATFIPEVSTERIVAVGHEAIGVQREQPTRINYGKPFSITVIENANFEVYKGIRKWFDELATNINAGSGGGSGSGSQRMAYYKEITSDMTLTKLENPQSGRGAARKVLSVTFKDAFPVSVGQIQLGSDLFDTATEFTASFSYTTYSYN